MGRRTKKAVTLTLKKPKSPERPLCQNSLGSYCDDYDDDVEDGDSVKMLMVMLVEVMMLLMIRRF